MSGGRWGGRGRGRERASNSALVVLRYALLASAACGAVDIASAQEDLPPIRVVTPRPSPPRGQTQTQTPTEPTPTAPTAPTPTSTAAIPGVPIDLNAIAPSATRLNL